MANRITLKNKRLFALFMVASVAIWLAAACGGDEAKPVATQAPVVNTVLVEKIVRQTVVIEKPVEKVVEKVVEKIVEKIVEKTVIVVQSATAAPATATPAPTATSVSVPTPPAKPTGTLIVVAPNTYNMNSIPRYCPACSVTARTGTLEFLLQAKRNADGTVGYENMLAESWKLSDDMKTIDFTLKRGVQFHKNYGEMTAEDVAWSWNDANPKTEPTSVHDTASDIGGFLTRVDVTDKYSVRFQLSAYGGNIPLQFFTNFQEGIGVFSKKVFDTLGPEKMREVLIGTGPFEMKEWTQFKGSYVTASPSHWRKTAYVAEVHTLEVPEAATRTAMLLTGQAHIGIVSLNDWPKLFAAGLAKAPEGFVGGVSIAFSGNYWEKKHAKTGETLTRTLVNNPWIGDPDDAVSMEKAKKVRQALNLDIDRELINKKVFGGLGSPVYGLTVDETHPLFQARWKTAYDPVQAKKLLTEAGYPNGFKLAPFYTNPAGDVELGEGIGVTWKNDLNIDVTYDRQNYNTFRPSIVNRTFAGVANLGCGSPGPFPPTWPFGINSSSLSFPGGYSSGQEIPKWTETFLKMNGQPDEAILKKAITELNDYNLEWRLCAPVVALPNFAIYNPRKVAEWRMLPEAKGLHGGVNQPEFIKLAP